jgi:hypothetical protein
MIRVDDLKHYDSARPIEQLLTLVLAAGARLGVVEFRFDYYRARRATGMWWRLGDEMQELLPPPAEQGPELMRLLLSGATLDLRRLPTVAQRVDFWKRYQEECPVFGTYPIRFGGVMIEFDFVYFLGQSGEHICLTKTTPMSLRHPAEWFFEQWTAAGRDAAPTAVFATRTKREPPNSA